MFAIKIDNGKAMHIAQPSLAMAVGEQGFLWVHLQGELEPTRNWLTQQNHIDSHTLDALCDEMTRPRVFLNNAEQLVLTQRVVHRTAEDYIELVSMRAWIDDHTLVTVSRVDIPAVSALAEKLMRKAKGISTPKHLIWQLAETTADQMTDYIVDLDERLIALEDDWDDKHQLDSDALIAIRHNLSRISKVLSPQLEAFQKLANTVDEHVKNNKDKMLHHSRWRETINAIKRDMESLNEMRERVSILKDALYQRTNETTNRTIFLLSIVSTFFLPLTFIASLLGMNVAGIPAHDHPLAFAAVCIFMLIIFCLQWLLFKRWHLLK